MTLPVSMEYLSASLKDGHDATKLSLVHRAIGELALPTGRLVACDPFVCPEDAQPFSLELPRGRFPVVLSVADFGTDQRVAFATIRFSASEPMRWEMLTLPNQDAKKLKPGEMFGYGVDSGTGCFMDAAAVAELVATSQADEAWFDKVSAEMDKTYRHTWSWLNHEYKNGNLVAFSSGLGDGFYGSYAAFTADGTLAVVLTDFGVMSDPAAPVVEGGAGPGAVKVKKRGIWSWLFGG